MVGKTAYNYLLRGPSYTALNFPLLLCKILQLLNGCYGKRVNLNNTVRLPDPENGEYVNPSRNYLLWKPSYIYHFEISMGPIAIFFFKLG